MMLPNEVLKHDQVSALLALGFESDERTFGVQESVRLDPSTHRVWRAGPSMGTAVSVVALHSSAAEAEDAIEAAFAEMGRLVSILDRHDSATPVAHLNAGGVLRDAPSELVEVISRALWYHRLTRGAFDVTVKPLVDLLRSSGGEPAPAEWAEAAELVGASRLRLSGRRLSFERSGMGITLDGIAKGYIVDQMADALTRHGMRRFLINAGGDIRAKGGKQSSCHWTIGVRDPGSTDVLCDVVSMTDGAVATSGNYEKPFAHIVDAGAGRPARTSLSVSVSAPEAMSADALATALFVLGPAAGCALARSLPGCECLIVDEAGRSAPSPGWSRARAGQVKHEP